MVSIIIPTHNRANILPKAVDSVLNQTFKDFELIIVDDGSSDHTSRYLETISDSRVLRVAQEHAGVSRARNRGIEKARFPWLAFLDSDDCWFPHKLERQIEALETTDLYSVIYTDEVWIRRGRTVNPKKKHRKYSGWIYRHCLPLCIISPSSVLLHRRVLVRIGHFDESLPVCEDYDLWLRVASRMPVLLIEEPLITKYGGHEDQLSKSRWGFDRFRVRALDKILRSGVLSYQQRIWTVGELQRKSAILTTGFRKRRNPPAAAYYERLSRFWADNLHVFDPTHGRTDPAENASNKQIFEKG